MTDEAIVELYWDRKEQAIKETEIKYERYLMKISYNILSDMEDSRENVNDTYLRAWNSMPPQRPAILSTYLGKISRQGAIDIYRKKTSKKRNGTEYESCLEELEEVLADRNSVEVSVDSMLLGKVLNEYLRTLPPAKRNVLIGRYFYMDSMKDIAGYTGMSEQNVKNILHRTRGELKEYLLKEGFAL